MTKNTREENAEKPGTLSRRAFLGKTAAVGIGVSGVAALACGSSDSKNDGGTTSGGSTATFDALDDSKLNPQDTSYTTYTTNYADLFSPLNIGSQTLKSRFVKSAAGSELTLLMAQDITSSLKRTTAFYENIAKGGVGMINFEGINLYETVDGGPAPGTMAMWRILDSSFDEDFKAVTTAVHAQNVPILAQMLGTFTDTSSNKSTSSEIDLNSSSARMSTDDVEAFIARLRKCAVNFQKVGFDGVDLNASCSHTLATFLSRFWNVDDAIKNPTDSTAKGRKDQYGPQSLENRARIVTELISGIKADCGKDFIVHVLFNGVEEDVQNLGNSSLCLKTEEVVALTKLFEAAGADALQVRSGAFGNHCSGFMLEYHHMPEHGSTAYGTLLDFSKHFDGMQVGKWDGTASLLDIAAEVKKNVSIPVGFVGCADARLAPDVINNAVRDHKVDFVVMNRPLMADPAFPNKLKAGKRDEVAPCNHCLTCFSGGLDFTIPQYCRVNPTHVRAYTPDMPEGPDVAKASTSKKVMVIGGGPAGMEAARIAAQRGHSVTLYDSNSALGGRMQWAAAVKGTHEKIADYISYLTRQQDVNGVRVVTGKTVTADDVKGNAPDVVIVAVGGTRPTLVIKGIDSSIVKKTTSTPDGTNVAILGFNFQAVDYAIRLVKYGKSVTLISSDSEDQLDVEHPVWPRYGNKVWLRSKGVQIYGGAEVTQIGDSGLTLTTSYGTTVDLELDAVVPFPSLVKNSTLYDAIKGMGYKVYEVGDCADPGTIAKAVASANLAARYS